MFEEFIMWYFVLFGIIGALLGAWIYSNANERKDRNAALWGLSMLILTTLMAILGSIIIAIAYLITRKPKRSKN